MKNYVAKLGDPMPQMTAQVSMMEYDINEDGKIELSEFTKVTMN